MIELSLKW